MTKPKRWPDHAEWARTDGIARQRGIKEKCKRLMRVPLNPAMKMVVMEIQLAAQETELSLVRAKDPGGNPGQD